MKLCLSQCVLLAFVGLAAAGPYFTSDREAAFSKLLGEELTNIQQTKCATRAHTVTIYLGHDTYVYKYRACLNHQNGMKCVDSSETLPKLCTTNNLEDCYEIEWHVRGEKTVFDICDDYGKPCQKPISGFMRTNAQGNCDRLNANVQGIKLCEEVDGSDDCGEPAIMTLTADTDAGNPDEDCFCIKPKQGHGKPICRGNCP